jgi:hypothetical protein
MATRARISDSRWQEGGIEVVYASEVNAVAVVIGITLIMVGLAFAKNQLVWRPLKHRVRRHTPVRRRWRRRRHVPD